MPRANEDVPAKLKGFLADTYVLLAKTQGCHWNARGSNFFGLHTLTEQQYEELFKAVDEIAERVRALGAPVPGSFSEFGKLAAVRESVGPVAAKQMIETLVTDQATVAASARRVIEAAEPGADFASADLGTRRMDVHEKNAWMLRSHLE